MRTKDLIAKRERRERKLAHKKRNESTSHKEAEYIDNDKYTLPSAFSEEVLSELKHISATISNEEILRRRDMRDILTCTIDPADAKDFDDALSFKVQDNGNYQIGIHIADVTHYVQEGTAVDEEAYQRGTSIYLVDRVIPMLPERLSNELCSLRPHEEKLCMSVILEMDSEAKVIRHKICRTVICSDFRLTYRQAQDILEEEQEIVSHDQGLSQALHTLNGLAKTLRANRFRHGAINFESQEIHFRLDEQGEPVEIFFPVISLIISQVVLPFAIG
jgi:ribonuclease R